MEMMCLAKCTDDWDAYLAVLKEKDGERILPVMLEKDEAFLLLMNMKRSKGGFFPSSVADIMWVAFKQCHMSVEEVRVIAVEGGVTYCHIYYKKDDVNHIVVFCKASDCLILAHVFSCPITISEDLLQRQYMRQTGEGTCSLPVNSVSVEALKEALKRAVEHENYELASQLRDEIERRK